MKLWLLITAVICCAAGIAHGSWWHAMPPMGFNTALAITSVSDAFLFAASFLGQLFKQIAG